MRPEESINDPLRKAIGHAIDDGATLYSIATAAGLETTMVRRFYRRAHANIRSDHAGALAAALGLRLAPGKEVK